MKRKLLHFNWVKSLPIALALLTGFQISCKDSVDTSDIYTFTGQTITDFIQADSSMTLFTKILSKSRISKNAKSHMTELLSARGHYTVFAPTDEAVKVYLDSIYASTTWDIDTMSEAVANQITHNCIIDHGTLSALLSSDFPETGAIVQATVNDRHILVSYTVDTLNNNKFAILLNKKSQIIKPDNELTNGYVHVVNNVICPSSENVPALIDQADNMRIFSYILKNTSWADSMKAYRDEEYELYTDEEKRNDKEFTSSTYVTPPHRYYGYMAFTESDSVFNADWGIPIPIMHGAVMTNEAEVRAAIEEKCKQAYPNATATDWKSKENAVNQFISYHLVGFKEPFNLLVRHGDEIGYNTDLPTTYTMCLYTFFHTMGKPNRLFKLTQMLNGEYRINRMSYFNNAFDGDMKETSVVDPGILVSGTNGDNDNNALNGYYYPINKVMTYSNFTRDAVLNCRIRYNLAQYFDEMMSNDLRTGIIKSPHYYIPHHPYFYCKHLMNFTDTDYRTPINAGKSGWAGIESDQFAFSNLFDVIFQLMPVPFAGTWEVRYSVSHLPERGLGQGYFGTNPQNLVAVGLPFDFRLKGSNPAIGSITDVTFAYDSVLCQENDRQMRNHMHMKSGRTYCSNQFGVAHTWAQSLRNSINVMRLIVYRGYMEPDKTYYFRFKTLLTNPKAYLFGDNFELVPKTVYDNPERPEDVW